MSISNTTHPWLYNPHQIHRIEVELHSTTLWFMCMWMQTYSKRDPWEYEHERVAVMLTVYSLTLKTYHALGFWKPQSTRWRCVTEPVLHTLGFSKPQTTSWHMHMCIQSKICAAPVPGQFSKSAEYAQSWNFFFHLQSTQQLYSGQWQHKNILVTLSCMNNIVSN